MSIIVNRDAHRWGVYFRAWCMDDLTRVSGEVNFPSAIRKDEQRVVSWPSVGPVGIAFAREFAAAILAVCDAVEKEPFE